MKNTNKTSRRSFLKQSSIGVLAVANGSLFSGLTNRAVAAITLAPTECVVSTTYTVDYKEEHFLTQAAAQQAADESAADSENYWIFSNPDTAVEQYGEFYGRGCNEIQGGRQTPDPFQPNVSVYPVINPDDLTVLWGYHLTGSYSVEWCD